MFVGDTGGDGWAITAESADPYLTAGKPDPWETLGRKLGVPSWQSSDGKTKYLFDMRGVVPYGSKLAVAAPCVSQGAC